MSTQPLIGILALQGNFSAHRTMMQTLQVPTRLIREPHQLNAITGLIIPGGESTAIIKSLLRNTDWQIALQRIKQIALPIFGTCAGLILLSKKVEPNQFSLGWLDVTVLRNGYGRQIDSHIIYAHCNFLDRPYNIAMPLIRAPKIMEVGSTVTPLIKKKHEIYLVEQDNLLAATFHPEITEDTSIHQYFLQKVRKYLNTTKKQHDKNIFEIQKLANCSNQDEY